MAVVVLQKHQRRRVWCLLATRSSFSRSFLARWAVSSMGSSSGPGDRLLVYRYSSTACMHTRLVFGNTT
ncbi:hypothetical protein CRUP_013146 [Coryphaenoides rupestris]|nr:hypothetical protein CRUP_013146 [Coryphaenoides rupestris]